MRFYQYKCDLGHVQEEYRATEDRHQRVECLKCCGWMVLQIAPVSGIVRSPAVPRRRIKKRS